MGKDLFQITCRLQGKQRRKTPWSYPKAHKAKQLIAFAKPRTTSFFPLQKLKGTQPALKTPIMCLAHLEDKSAKKDEEVESKDPNGITRVMEEFMVHLVRAVKDTQVEEKCCYHCSSLEHCIHNCPLVKALGANTQLNCMEGMALKKGARASQIKATMCKTPQEEAPKVLHDAL